MPEQDLPPELARMREQDREHLVKRLQEQGLTEEQAKAHARSELQERDWMERAELRTPGMSLAENVPDKSGKPGKERREQA